MDDERERLLENERLQMEQIRQLDMEELQIEIVGDDGVSSDDDDRHPLRGHEFEGAEQYEGFTFNTCLASLHTYLGEFDDTHGRLTLMDGGAVLNLPTFYLEGVVLFPEATLPLRVIQPEYKAAVEKALNQVDAPCIIGVIGVHRHPRSHRLLFGAIGTTAEIRQYKYLDDGSLNVVARGQQRFHMRRQWIDIEGAPYAEVQIIEEDSPLRIPKDAFAQLASISNFRRCTKLNPVSSHASPSLLHKHEDEEDYWECKSDASVQSYNSDSPLTYGRFNDLTGSESEDDVFKHEQSLWKSHLEKLHGSHQQHKHERMNVSDMRSCQSSKEFTPKRTPRDGERSEKNEFFSGSKRAYMAPLSFWPLWVYRMHDSYSLAQRAADLWSHIIGAPNMDDLVNKPDLLSFYIGSRLPLSQSTRQELLEINGVSYRLQREIKLLECFNLVRCKNCRTVIAKRSDMLVMSSDGPLNAFVNPHGYVHEIMTFFNASGLALLGAPVKEHSWFPGYAWTITNCASCESNMGWLFTATTKKLKPKSFWGVRSCQVSDDACKDYTDD